MPTRLDGRWRTSEERAHANGVTLRIDVMKQNVLGLISELQEEDHSVVRYSVSALSRDFRTVIAQTDDVGRVERAVRMFSLSWEVHNRRNGASLCQTRWPKERAVSRSEAGMARPNGCEITS